MHVALKVQGHFTVEFAKKIITVAVHKYTERNGRGKFKKCKAEYLKKLF